MPCGTLSVQPFNKVSHYNNHVTYQAVTSVQVYIAQKYFITTAESVFNIYCQTRVQKLSARGVSVSSDPQFRVSAMLLSLTLQK